MNYRQLRRTLEFGLPVIGVLAILTGALIADDDVTRIALIAVGIVFLLVTSFDLDQNVLPNQRRSDALRAEVNQFLRTVRRMNRAAAAATHSTVDLDRFETASEELLQRARVIAETAANTHGIKRETLAPTP